MANSIEPDETARNEPSHLDLHCLHRYLFSSEGLKRLTRSTRRTLPIYLWCIGLAFFSRRSLSRFYPLLDNFIYGYLFCLAIKCRISYFIHFNIGLYNRFMEQYYAWLLRMTHRIGYIFGALAHSLYTRNSLDPQDTEAWKYHYSLTQNSGPEFREFLVRKPKFYCIKEGFKRLKIILGIFSWCIVRRNEKK